MLGLNGYSRELDLGGVNPQPETRPEGTPRKARRAMTRLSQPERVQRSFKHAPTD